jgi:hypothetical protein
MGDVTGSFGDQDDPAAAPSTSGPLAARWFVPTGLTVVGILATALFSLITFAVAVWRPELLGAGLGIALAWHVSYLLMSGGYVRADDRGVEARNIFLRHRFGWTQVVRFEASMNVVVLAHDGSRTTLWAVQRAQFAAMTGARSRVDDAVAELERHRIARLRTVVSGEQPDTAPPSRGIVRLTAPEWVQLATVMPGAAAAGLLVASL